MDVCQHTWLCFINVLIAGIKPSPLIHPNAPYSCWEVEDGRMSSKGHISSVFYPTKLPPTPFPHLQVSPKFHFCGPLNSLCCLFYLQAYLRCGLRTALQAAAGFCPESRAAVRAHGIWYTGWSNAAQQPRAEPPAWTAGQPASVSCSCSSIPCPDAQDFPQDSFMFLAHEPNAEADLFPTDHAAFNSFRSLIAEEVIRRRRKCVDLSSCLP